MVIATPQSFSTMFSVRVTITDDSGLCKEDCRLGFQRGVMEAILVWGANCTRCTVVASLLVKVVTPPTSTLKRWQCWRGTSHQGRQPIPKPNQRLASTTTSFISGHQQLNVASGRVLAICKGDPEEYGQLAKVSATLRL